MEVVESLGALLVTGLREVKLQKVETRAGCSGCPAKATSPGLLNYTDAKFLWIGKLEVNSWCCSFQLAREAQLKFSKHKYL